MSTRRPPRLLLRSLLCAGLLAVMLPGVGCTDQQVEQFRAGLAEARAASAELDPVIADIETQIAESPIGDDVRPLLDALAEATTKKAQLDAAAADFQARIAETTDPVAIVGSGLSAVSPAVPAPWGVWVGVAGTLLAGFAEGRRRRTKKAAENVVISIEETKTPDGQIDFRIDGDKLRSRMSTEARELVETARNKVPPRVIPLEPLVVEPRAVTPETVNPN